MAIVSSAGRIQAVTGREVRESAAGRGAVYLGLGSTSYAAIYRSQPNVRTVVEFLGRNLAQLGIHVFRRRSDTDRERLTDHGLARTLAKPNPRTTRYRLIDKTVQDMGIYFNAIWLKLETPEGLGLLRLPPEEVAVEGGLLPSRYYWTPASGGGTREFAPDDVVHFSGYDPCNPFLGVSPLETLRRILEEEQASGDYRHAFWTNAARVEGIITRPAKTPWTAQQRQQFRHEWQDMYAGALNAGRTVILEDGMGYIPNGQTAKDSEYLSARKLTREECAAAYHVPLPMVGILEHATFSNIREQHKNLYQDCLGPWCVMFEEDIELQLLPEYPDADNVYVEFNIAEKLKGSFEEQARSLQTLVGMPVMTVNEGRARLNLPQDPNEASDAIARPLNMETAPTEDDEAVPDTQPPRRPSVPAPAEEDDDAAAAWTATVRRFWARQQARIDKQPLDQRAAGFDARRWNLELASDLRPFVATADEAQQIAAHINAETFARLTVQIAPFGADRDDHRPAGLVGP